MLEIHAHLHNSNLMANIWIDNNAFFNEYSSINPDIVLNHFGHLFKLNNSNIN
jgi:hypothetical protein